MPVTGLIGAFLHGAFNGSGYWFGNVLSTVIWIMCALSFGLINTTLLTVEKKKNQKTIELFFMANAIICLIELIQMMVVSQHFFPYWYTELDYIYGVSTGDHLHGIFQDNSTVNAAICLLSIFYFIGIKRYTFAAINMAICLLCTSNLTVFILLAAIGLAFFLYDKQRKLVFGSGVLCIALYLFISPSNIHYVDRVISKINKQVKNKNSGDVANEHSHNIAIKDTVLLSKKDKISLAAKIDGDVNNKPINIAYQPCIIQHDPFPSDAIIKDFAGPITANLGTTSLYYNEHIPEDTNALRNVMEKWYGIPYKSLPLSVITKPGKLMYIKNTISFLKSGTGHLFFGAGPGNFSSKLAIKMTGFKLQGNYPARYAIIDRAYFENTFYVHMFFWAKSIPDRSIINYPGSVYGQIAGEYGVFGILLFLVFYFLYFFKKALIQKQKFVLLFAVLLLFFFDYWFELLNLTILFELLMLMDFETDKEKKTDITEMTVKS
jgi:hypothetical protein